MVSVEQLWPATTRFFVVLSKINSQEGQQIMVLLASEPDVGSISTRGQTISAEFSTEKTSTAQQLQRRIAALIRTQLNLQNATVKVETFWEVQIDFRSTPGNEERRLIEEKLARLTDKTSLTWSGHSLYIVVSMRPGRNYYDRLEHLLEA